MTGIEKGDDVMGRIKQLGRSGLLNLLAVSSVVFLGGCHMAKSNDDLINAAKVETRKEILSEYEIGGKIAFQNIHIGKGEGDSLLGTVCGAFIDSGYAAEGQTPTRFIYTAIDDDTLLEETLEDVTMEETPELLAAMAATNKLFNELWSDGCN